MIGFPGLLLAADLVVAALAAPLAVPFVPQAKDYLRRRQPDHDQAVRDLEQALARGEDPHARELLGFAWGPAELAVGALTQLADRRLSLRYASLGGRGRSVSSSWRFAPNRPEVALGLEWLRPFGGRTCAFSPGADGSATSSRSPWNARVARFSCSMRSGGRTSPGSARCDSGPPSSTMPAQASRGRASGFWLHDLGVGVRLKFRATLVRIDLGHGLVDASNALTVGVGHAS